ncbi:hypothetical protein ACFYZ9_06080 [Streptomyces sp. NPDC001691]|uniref:hypothetical protein n=1 Tax=Streptomyces sp. NPDC001691 TaxID=3364600 RepID=UPI00368F4BFD
MSMPPPPPSQGPYHPQPQGPYGAPPPGPPAPGPYGAQQPWPQQPYPQQGFQQPQFPQQGWGVPPMGPPPPRKSRAGLVVGIIAVVLVVLGGLGFSVNRLLGAAGGFPEAKYRLTVPPTLMNGQYTLAQDLSEKCREGLKGSSQADIRDPRAAVGQYAGAKGDGTSMVLSGIYGRVKSPERERDSMLRGAREADGATVAVPAKDATPAGSEVRIHCQVLTKSQGALSVTFPMCAWGDGNTVGSVAVVSPASAGQKAADIDIAEAAGLTAKVRDEIRKPIG